MSEGVDPMTILVFPSALGAAARFADEARRWGRRTVGASSLETDPNAGRFDAWERLPFIGDPDFFDALQGLSERRQIRSIFTPHAPTFHLLQQQLPLRLPQLALIGEGPFEQQMTKVRTGLAAAEAGLATAASYGGAPSPLPVEFLAGLLAQVDRLHGECSGEKILALCGIVPFAPPGDVVEIGSLYGKSSYVLNRLAAYCRIGATLAVDPWELELSIQQDAPANIQDASRGWDWSTVYRGFLLNMLGCSVPPFNYLRTTSARAAADYGRNRAVTSREFGTTALAGHIAVLHLDGNHDEAAVAEDFALWSRYLAPGGWLVFDDYNWPHGDGPRKVADRALQQYGDRVRRHFVAGGALFINVAG